MAIAAVVTDWSGDRYVNENAVTVIVRSADLTSSQVAQIQSIVTRQLNVEATNISISNK